MGKDYFRPFSASLLDSTREALEISASNDKRSAAKQCDVLIREALEARAARNAAGGK